MVLSNPSTFLEVGESMLLMLSELLRLGVVIANVALLLRMFSIIFSKELLILKGEEVNKKLNNK